MMFDLENVGSRLICVIHENQNKGKNIPRVGRPSSLKFLHSQIVQPLEGERRQADAFGRKAPNVFIHTT